MAAMRAIDVWELRGRLAVRTKKRGDSMNMYWERDGAGHYINLYGPLGAGRVILTLDEEGAVLRDSKGKTHTDDSAESLLYRAAGWRVPFRPLQYWVLGVAAPGSEYQAEVDRWGRLSELEQDGWRIRFEAYHYYDGQDMPRKLTLNALPGVEHIVDDVEGEGETVQVKAVIRSWEWSRN